MRTVSRASCGARGAVSSAGSECTHAHTKRLFVFLAESFSFVDKTQLQSCGQVFFNAAKSPRGDVSRQLALDD
jgi:hypothetical protein